MGVMGKAPLQGHATIELEAYAIGARLPGSKVGIGFYQIGAFSGFGRDHDIGRLLAAQVQVTALRLRAPAGDALAGGEIRCGGLGQPYGTQRLGCVCASPCRSWLPRPD